MDDSNPQEDPSPESENEECLRISREITRNISMKREGRSTFVTFNDFFTKDPLDNSIPVCTLRESITSEHRMSERISVLENSPTNRTPRESVTSETASDSSEDRIDSIADDTDPKDKDEGNNARNPDAEKKQESKETPTSNNERSSTDGAARSVTTTMAPEKEYFKVESEIESGLKSLNVLQTADDGYIWTANRKEIAQVGPDEAVIFKQELDIAVDDLAVLGSNSVFLVESQSKTIRFLKIEADEPVITIFDALSPDTPERICINTKTREVVTTVLSNKGVLFFKRSRASIKRYHYNGKCIDEITPKNDGKFIFDNSLDMVCNGNGDLCIVATKGSSQFVVVFDHSVNFRFLYNGGDGKPASFRPTSVSVDCDNNILILESNSNSVHIVNQEGSLLNTVSCVMSGSVCPKVKALCTYKEGKVLLGQDDGKIRVLKSTALAEKK